LCEDPQLVGALGAALFAGERYRGKVKKEEIKVSYGYSDGTGEYFITIDTDRCDGCGQCVPVCPSGVFIMAESDSGQLKVKVKEEARKKLAFLCPGFHSCSRQQKDNCCSICTKEAISLTW
jgi:NAD-dependent dihydropyrimidine dehydrogenase PreA subunit